MRAPRALLAAVAALAAAAPAAARERTPTAAWTSRALTYLLDVCPRVLAGEVRLDDPAAVRALGLEPTAPSNAGLLFVQALDRRRPQPITLGFNDSPDKQGCKVSFDDPGMRFTRALHAGLVARGWTPAGSSLPELVSFYTPPSPTITDRLMLVRFGRIRRTEAWAGFTLIRNKARVN
jgi:hypothetical protein